MTLGCGEAPPESPAAGTEGTTSVGSTSGTPSTSTGTSEGTGSAGDSTSGGEEESSTTGAAFEAAVSIIATQRDPEDELSLSLLRIDYADGVTDEPEVLTPDVRRFLGFLELSPGASALTYQTFDPGGPFETYVVGLDDGRPLTTSHLTDPARPEFTRSRMGVFTPDESQVIFATSVPDGGPSQTYIAPVVDGELGALHALDEVTAPSTFSVSFSADGARMMTGLHMVSLADPFEITELPPTDPSFYVANGPRFAEGDDVVWYRLSGNDREVGQLLYVDVSAPPPWTAVPVHTGLGSAQSPVASPDGRWLEYSVEDGETLERYAVRFEGAEVSIPVSLGTWTATTDSGAFELAWSADGSTLAFRADANRMYVVDMSGDTPGQPVLVSSEDLPPDVLLGFPQLDPDGAWVYYRRFVSEEGTLYRASVTGELAEQPQPVSDGQDVVGNGFRDITISPDGMGAVFIEQPDSMWLEYAAWYVDLSGPMPGQPVRLGSELPPSGTATDPQWSSDSQSVVVDFSENGFFGPNTYYLVDRSAPDSLFELGMFEDLLVIDPVALPE